MKAPNVDRLYEFGGYTLDPTRRLLTSRDGQEVAITANPRAIRGPIRADFFFGYGAEAGTQAGMMKYDGEMWLLWPKAAPPPQ